MKFGKCGIQAFFSVGSTGVIFSIGKKSKILVSKDRSSMFKVVTTFCQLDSDSDEEQVDKTVSQNT